MTRFLDEVARELARPMPRSRAFRLLGGALIAVAVPSLRPRLARGASKRPLDECDHPLRCVGRKTCGILVPNAGPSEIPVCNVACCDEQNPVCCKWPGLEARNVPPGKGNGTCSVAYGIVCCCPRGSRCGDLAAGEFACERRVCGPDVTAALGDAVSRTESAFAKWSSLQRAAACTALVQTPIGAVGWEINQLGPGNREQGEKNFQPECATCGGSLSVQVGDGCHYAGSVNYVIYGVMLRLCHDHLESMHSTLSRNYDADAMDLYITLWKSLRRAPNLTASLHWAKAGYNGWPSGTTPPPELPNCAKCRKPLTSRLTVRWLPLDRNI
jgi:hypothetical protein